MDVAYKACEAFVEFSIYFPKKKNHIIVLVWLSFLLFEIPSNVTFSGILVKFTQNLSGRGKSNLCEQRNYIKQETIFINLEIPSGLAHDLNIQWDDCMSHLW